MNFLQIVLYSVFKTLAFVFSYVPAKSSYFAGRLLGRQAFYILTGRKSITIDNLREAFPEKDYNWCYRTAGKVFENYGLNLMKFLRFALNPVSCSVKTHGMEVLGGPSPKIMLGCHLGNWEIAGMAVVASGYEIFPVAKRIHTPASQKLVDGLRKAFGGEMLSDRGGIRAVLSRLRDDKTVYILFDQRIKKGMPFQFFNRPVWGAHTVSLLQRRTGADIIPCWSRSRGESVEVYYGPAFKMITEGDPLRADLINTQNHFYWLEDKIRRDPAQWYWVHDMWRPRKRGWKTVFLDRDGTLNVDKGYVSKKEELEFMPGVFETLRKLRKAGYLLVIVTNQSGIARGYYSEADYIKFRDYFLERLFKEGVIIDRTYHCPHHPDDGCSCRKPEPGMLRRAIDELRVSTSQSYIIGDKTSDVLAGKNAGLKTIAVGRGDFKEAEPDYKVLSIQQAGKIILEND